MADTDSLHSDWLVSSFFCRKQKKNPFSLWKQKEPQNTLPVRLNLKRMVLYLKAHKCCNNSDLNNISKKVHLPMVFLSFFLMILPNCSVLIQAEVWARTESWGTSGPILTFLHTWDSASLSYLLSHCFSFLWHEQMALSSDQQCHLGKLHKRSF